MDFFIWIHGGYAAATVAIVVVVEAAIAGLDGVRFETHGDAYVIVNKTF